MVFRKHAFIIRGAKILNHLLIVWGSLWLFNAPIGCSDTEARFGMWECWQNRGLEIDQVWFEKGSSVCLENSLRLKYQAVRSQTKYVGYGASSVSCVDGFVRMVLTISWYCMQFVIEE